MVLPELLPVKFSCDPRFKDAAIKVTRAATHLQDLHNHIGEWAAQLPDLEPIRLVKDVDRKEWGAAYRLPDALPRPPEVGSAIVGDLVHNLRSALDAIAWRLVEHGSKPERAAQSAKARDISFPIFWEAVGDRSAAQRFNGCLSRTLPGVDSAAIEVVKAHQPFAGDGRPEHHPLAVLARASNEDKHRRLHAGVAVPEGLSIGGETDATGQMEISAAFRREAGGIICDPKSVIVTVATTRDLELHIQPIGLQAAYGSDLITLPQLASIMQVVVDVLHATAPVGS